MVRLASKGEQFLYKSRSGHAAPTSQCYGDWGVGKLEAFLQRVTGEAVDWRKVEF